MALNLNDNWQMAKILTDNWHLYRPIQTLQEGFFCCDVCCGNGFKGKLIRIKRSQYPSVTFLWFLNSSWLFFVL